MKKVWKFFKMPVGIVVGIAAFLLVIISILFYNIDLNANDGASVKFDGLAAFGQITAALFTAVTVFLFVQQNKLQIDNRNAATQPLVLPTFTQFLTKDEDIYDLEDTEENKSNHLHFPIFSKLNEPPISVVSTRVFIELHNIGLATAVNIEADWSYNINEVNEYVGNVYYTGFALLKTQKLDFIAVNRSNVISIPYHYMVCCGEKLNPTGFELTFEKKVKPKPPLNLTIKYTDVYNKRKIKSFDVGLECYLNSVNISFTLDDNKKD